MKASTKIAAGVVVWLMLGVHPGHAEWKVGARLGGYGFRQAPGDQGDNRKWRECRMDGAGIFGEYKLGSHVFAEAGVDGYFLQDWVVGGESGSDWAIDRTSILTTAAVGVRLWPGYLISPNIHIGGGLERTKVTMGTAITTTETHFEPLAFIGVGGDLRVGRVNLGMALRLHTMTLFSPNWVVGDVKRTSEFAAQMQFYAKYRL